MKNNRYSFSSLFKLTFTFCIIFGVINSVSANENTDVKQKTPENAEQQQKSNNTKNEIKTGKNKNKAKSDNTNSSSGKIQPNENLQLVQPFEDNTKNLENKEVLTIKNILLLFTIVNLPISVLLLVLWITNKRQQKQNFDEFTNKQDSISRKLNELEKINRKLSSLDKTNKEIIDKIQVNKEELTSSRTKLRELIEKLQVFPSVVSHNNRDLPLSHDPSFSSLTNEQPQHQLDTQNYSSVAVANPVPHFVDQYNQDKQSLSNEATVKVSATEESLNKIRTGYESKLILENTIQKRYLIIQEDGDYFLVPHAKIKINEHNKSSLETLFECINLTPEYDDFQLIQPAKVSQLDSELWQLDQKGKLEFS